jgi:hypothetical protein
MPTTREKWDPIRIANRRFSSANPPTPWFRADCICRFLRGPRNCIYVAVAASDLIFTGTPAGVGPIQRGELVRGAIDGIDPVEVTFE